MSDINISNNIIIDEAEETADRLRQFSRIDCLDFNDVVDFIKNEYSTKFFFDEKMNLKEEGDRGVRYCWLDTGLEGPNKNPLFLSLLYQGGYFVGHYTGDWKFLSSTIIQYFPANTRMINENLKKFEAKYLKRIEKREVKHLTDKYAEFIKGDVPKPVEPRTAIGKSLAAVGIMPSPIATDTEDEILEKESYEPSVPAEITNDVLSLLMINNWKSKEGLDRYLKVIGSRLWQLIEQNKTEYYILNNIKSAVVNTGLLNQFGADIFVLYRLNVTYKVYTAYQILESKTDYLDNGFTKEQISQEILPISFFDEEEFFNATIDDFDVNHRSLLHIIEERRDRFPENVRILSSNTIATKINNALELGLKMQKRDRHYAKPSYSSKTKSISWMMPLHINRELTEEPELVLVIRRNREFYEIKTIIAYDDDMKDKITALSLYNGLW